MADAILVLNAGSSSIKFALFTASAAPARIAAGEIEGIGTAPHFIVHGAAGALAHEPAWPRGATLSHEQLFAPVLDWVENHLEGARLIAAGHRIVHGGTAFSRPVVLDDTVLKRLERLNPLAPLHEPHNLAAIAAVMKLRPYLPQIGCFDTAFHRTLPELATRFALPRHLHDTGVRRYGFHGLSYEFIAGRLRGIAPELGAGRVIAAHLGNGASLCAMRDGKSVDSTMGFTALDGLMMGTRCGTLDPGVVLYLMQAQAMDAGEISELLYKKSGLLGVSGISADMRVLLASAEPAAAAAVDLFCFTAARHIAALTVALSGLDGLVFTAGIGERAPQIRSRICAYLEPLGAVLDPAANVSNEASIGAPDSRVKILVIPTDEELMIAKHCMTVLGAARGAVFDASQCDGVPCA